MRYGALTPRFRFYKLYSTAYFCLLLTAHADEPPLRPCEHAGVGLLFREALLLFDGVDQLGVLLALLQDEALLAVGALDLAL